MATTWSSNYLAIYRKLHLRLAIANDLSLVIGFTRIDRKVSLMQLGHQFNSYSLMHNQESYTTTTTTTKPFSPKQVGVG
jgi:hypothetical protein